MNFTSVRHFILAILSLFLGCDSEPEVSVPDQVNWINANAYRPTSVDPINTNFEDLQFLKNVIGDRRLVMLGEQTHGDGTTFYAKTRLIKFLHEEMGFDILAFESGIYDCHKSWLEMKAGKNGIQAAKNGISKVWSYTTEVYPLFEYIDNAPYTLELVGVDPQFFGEFKDEFASDLQIFLQNRNSFIVNEADWADKKSMLIDLLNAKHNPSALGESKLNDTFTLIESIVSEIEMFDQTKQEELLDEAGFWLQVLYNLEMITQIYQMWEVNDYNGSIIRDEVAGNNLSWILDRYPDRKVIVWAASTHISRNAKDVAYYQQASDDYVIVAPYFVSMGDYIHEKYGDEVYSIAFTAYEGTYLSYYDFNVYPITKPHDGSLEDFLNQTNEEYLFINYRSNIPNWMSGVFVSTVFGYNNAKNDWANSFDGIFYTRNMEASHFIP